MNSCKPQYFLNKTMLNLFSSSGVNKNMLHSSWLNCLSSYTSRILEASNTTKNPAEYSICMCAHSTFLWTKWHFLFISHMIFRHRHISCSLALCSRLQMSLFTCNGSWSDYRKEPGQSRSLSHSTQRGCIFSLTGVNPRLTQHSFKEYWTNGRDGIIKGIEPIIKEGCLVDLISTDERNLKRYCLFSQ